MVEIIKTTLNQNIPNVNITANDVSLNYLINNNKMPKYISFDGRGIDLLDNNKTFYTEEDYKGYISDKTSNENGLFEYEANEPLNQIVFTHDEPLTFAEFKKYYPFITIAFYGDCCRKIEIKYYGTGNVSYVEEKTVDSNIFVFTPNFEALKDFSIQQIAIEFIKTSLPHQTIKIGSIKFGKTVVYNKLRNIELLEEINVISEDLPINELNFSVMIPTLTESEKPFEYGDLINIYSNNNYYGTFYVIESERVSKNTYSAKCQNSIYILENTTYKEWGLFQTLEESKDKYPKPDELPSGTNTFVFGNYSMQLKYFASVISKLSGIEINIPDDEYFTIGYIPSETCRYAMCLFAFANALMIDSSRNDKISILKIPQKVSSVITTNDKRIIGECTLIQNSPITSSNLQFKTYDYYNVGESEKVIFKFKADDNTVLRNRIIQFTPESPIELEYNPLSDNFFVFLNSPNLIEFLIKSFNKIGSGNEPNEFYLPIRKLIPNVEDIKLENDSIHSKPNIKDFSKFTLKGDIENLKNNIKTYMKSRGIVKGKIRLRGEKVGDLIEIETAYDGMVTGIIQSMNIRFGYEDIAEIEVLEWPIE